VALLDQGAELPDQTRDPGGVVGLAFDDELVPLGPNLDVEERFEVAEVFVIRPEEGLDAGLRDGDLS
jgi:hypothetical protein